MSETSPLFRDFDQLSLMLAANDARCEKFGTEEMVYLKGSIGTKLFIILKGGCEAYTSNEAEGEEIMITKLVSGIQSGQN